MYNLNMSKNKKLDIVALFLDFAILVFEAVGFSIALAHQGIGIFVYYTQLSNLLLMIATGLYLIYLLRRIFGGKHQIPRWVEILKFQATIGVTLTFVVSVALLSWMTGWGLQRILTSGAMLYHHTICPLLAVASFIFFEKYNIRRGAEIAWGITPTILYAAVAIVANAARFFEGPYPFLMVYRQPVFMSVFWCALILGCVWGIALVLRAADRAMRKPIHKKRP